MPKLILLTALLIAIAPAAVANDGCNDDEIELCYMRAEEDQGNCLNDCWEEFGDCLGPGGYPTESTTYCRNLRWACRQDCYQDWANDRDMCYWDTCDGWDWVDLEDTLGPVLFDLAPKALTAGECQSA